MGGELKGLIGFRLVPGQAPSPARLLERIGRRGGGRPTLLQWILVWNEPQSAPYDQYSDGLEDDDDDFVEQLSNNHLLLGGDLYELEWLEGDDAQEALRVTLGNDR